MITTYIALSYGYWGKGLTEADALTQLKKSGSKKTAKTILFRNDRAANEDSPYVDNYGSIMYHGTLTKIAEINNGKRKELV